MTLREVVNQLKGRGVPVEFRVRPDYSIVITKIAGEKYSGRSGNIAARNLIGVQMSGSEILQRTAATRARVPGVKLPPLDKEIKNALRRAQAAYRKAGMEAGKPTTENIRGAMKEGLTRSEILDSLRRSKQYAEGIAYDERLVALRDRLKLFGAIFTDVRNVADFLADLIDKLLQKPKHHVLHTDFEHVLEILYNAEQAYNFGHDMEAKTEFLSLVNLIAVWR